MARSKSANKCGDYVMSHMSFDVSLNLRVLIHLIDTDSQSDSTRDRNEIAVWFKWDSFIFQVELPSSE